MAEHPWRAGIGPFNPRGRQLPAVTDGEGNGSSGTRGRYSLVWRSVRSSLASESRLLRSYAVVGAVLAVLVALGFLLALPQWVVWSLGGSATVTFSRAFLLLTGLAVLASLLTPIVVAGRRHDRDTATPRGDFLLAASGYLFVVSMYLALLISAPPDSRDPPPEAVAPVVEFLYGLDPVYGLVPPVVAAVLVAVTARVR